MKKTNYLQHSNSFVKCRILLFSLLYLCFVNANIWGQTEINTAKQFIELNASKYKLSPSDITGMTVSSSYLSPTTGWYHIYFNQAYQSVEVFNGVLGVTLKDGNVVHVNSSFISNLASRVPTEVTKIKLSPLDALQKTSSRLDLKGSIASAVKELSSSKLSSGTITQSSYSDKNLSNETIDVKLYWLPYQTESEGKTITKFALTWNVRFNSLDRKNAWTTHVDAISGEVLTVKDEVIHCDFGTPNHSAVPHICTENILPTGNKPNSLAANSYSVFDYPLESPNHGSQTIVTNPYTRFAPANTGPGATNGWHTDGTNTYTNTQGNNVWAKDDIANDNDTTIGYSPSSATLEFNFPYTHSTGTAATNLSAAVTNLFYWNNIMHDVLWRYGFDEPSGNFQANNQGRGGQGNDFVYADAQDGSGTNNANFQTPTDGGNGRMQMYIWSNGGTPTYTPDSDFDNGVIAHEYGHGWSIRLTGGPANSSCLQNAEQGGEGWSDYAALMVTTNWASLTPSVASANISRGIGTYVTTQPTTGGGIRPFPYSYNMASVNTSVTYASVGNSSFSQPHGIGSIWATMLWDMTWEIILQDNQIINNIYNTPANVTDMRGNIAALKLVNEGLRLQPCSPSFVDARDAILQADQLLFGGRYRCAIGRAFARRGLGSLASTGTSSNDRTVVEDFTPISGVELNSQTTLTTCSNTTLNYTATSATSGISFSWTRPAVTGISNPSSSGNSANIRETLINTTNAPIVVRYLFALSPNPCSNTNGIVPVNVIVNPTPTASVGTYSVNQFATVPAGEGLVANNPLSSTINGTVSNTGSTYVRSNTGTVYSTGVSVYYKTYSFVAPVTGSMTFETTAASLFYYVDDTHLSIYQNSFNPASPASNFLAADDDSGVGLLSSISQNVTAGTTYIIVVSTWNSLDYGTFTLRASSPIFQNNLSWYLNASGGTPLATGNIFNPVGVTGSGIANTSTTGTYNFYLASADFPTCRTQTIFNILLVNSVGGTLPSETVCSGNNSGNLPLTRQVGSILRWEMSTDNFFNIINPIANTSTTQNYSNLTQNTQYRVVVQNGSNPIAYSSIGSITVLASIPVATGTSIALGSSVTLAATGCTGTGAVLKWYKSTDNTLISMPITPNISTSYYAKCEQTFNSLACTSTKSNDVMVLVMPTTIIYVNKASSAIIQDGTSWTNAISDLQNALAVATIGTEIWVAKGTYLPTNTLNRTISFNIPSGVKLYGGFNGTETSVSQRNVTLNPTILDGNLGVPDGMRDNSYHVITIINNTTSSTIDGFVITRGFAADEIPTYLKAISDEPNNIGNAILSTAGAGIYIKNSSPIIQNCNIIYNQASYGAGVFTEDVSPATIKLCTLSANSATLGGAVYNASSNPNFSNCLITGNKSFGGAAIYNNNSHPTISNTTITGNDCIANVIFNGSGTTMQSHPVIMNSIIWNNTGSNIGTSSIITYSNIEGGYIGAGNINIDPQFVVNPMITNAPSLAGNFRLLVGSPCINTGNNGTISLTDTDLDGKLRRYDGENVDMGAYEYIFYFDSATSGNWNVPATWTCNCVPDGTLPVRINSNHQVNIPDGYTGQAKGIMYKNTGTLTLTGSGKIDVSN